MRILFMGTPEYALFSLKALVEAGETIIGAVTQPDKPKGRGYELCPPPVKVFAIDREAIEALLGCEKIVYLAAVGYPAETPRSVDVAASDSVAYYIDENDTLTVPKIRLEDVMKWR